MGTPLISPIANALHSIFFSPLQDIKHKSSYLINPIQYTGTHSENLEINYGQQIFTMRSISVTISASENANDPRSIHTLIKRTIFVFQW